MIMGICILILIISILSLIVTTMLLKQVIELLIHIEQISDYGCRLLKKSIETSCDNTERIMNSNRSVVNNNAETIAKLISINDKHNADDESIKVS